MPFMICTGQERHVAEAIPRIKTPVVLIATLSIPFLLWMAFLLVPAALRGKLDFVSYYSAGRIVLTNPSRLYDYSLECNTQRFATGSQDCSPFIHPAYESLVFAPFSFLPYRAAYILFGMCNLCLLALVWRELRPPWELAAFAPLTIAIVFGQDSVLLLGVVTGAWTLIRKHKFWLAGIFLGLGSFRFQDIVPIILLMVLWREWRLVRGFLVSGFAVFVISIALASPREYLSVLTSLSFQPTTIYVQRVMQMVNLRALLTAMVSAKLVLPLLIFASASATLLIMWLGRNRQTDERFSVALLGTSLISFHLYSHDLCLLLIPLSREIRAGSRFNPVLVAFVMAGAMLPVFNYRAYFACVPVLLLLLFKALSSCSRIRELTCTARAMRGSPNQ